MQFCDDTELAAFKTATLRGVKMAGGLEATSTITRIGKSQLERCYNPGIKDCFVPVDVALSIDRAGRDPSIAAALASALGYGLLPFALGRGDVERDLERVSASAGATLTDAIRAIRDGFPPKERRRLEADLSELELAVRETRGRLAQMPAAAVGPRVVAA